MAKRAAYRYAIHMILESPERRRKLQFIAIIHRRRKLQFIGVEGKKKSEDMQKVPVEYSAE